MNTCYINLLYVQEKFDLQGKVEDSDIFSRVAKLRKEFKSTSKTRYYKEMVQEGRPVEELYENNPPGVHDDKWKWLVERWGTPQVVVCTFIRLNVPLFLLPLTV
ncbi:hypothetical protein Golax_003557 [Gossypium laxum]|uniref:Uncharacterized protein n=1 Tax=Gossypium laxum TaxID=34288 RepID=A0A7J9AFS7_9ROSI|nr:hypothetical protein [Gossypium laxum]